MFDRLRSQFNLWLIARGWKEPPPPPKKPRKPRVRKPKAVPAPELAADTQPSVREPS